MRRSLGVKIEAAYYAQMAADCTDHPTILVHLDEISCKGSDAACMDYRNIDRWRSDEFPETAGGDAKGKYVQPLRTERALSADQRV
jgi:hypothetical protein